MNIEKITIIKGRGPDWIFIFTNLPEACYPYKDQLTLEFKAAADTGVEYCAKHFPGIPVFVIDRC